MKHEYLTGEPVVYRLTKQSRRPGPRARNVNALSHGDYYSYTVEKYWVVARAPGHDGLVIRTRRGKRRTIRLDDPNLRPAKWWEKIVFNNRFPTIDDEISGRH